MLLASLTPPGKHKCLIRSSVRSCFNGFGRIGRAARCCQPLLPPTFPDFGSASPNFFLWALVRSTTAVRRMARRWAWARRRQQTLSPTSLATPATPSPWTARPSARSLWISWTWVPPTSTAPPARPTPAALRPQTCTTEASAWGSTPTTRTRPPPYRCQLTRRAPPP